MPEAPRHAKLKTPATRLRVSVMAVATLAGVAAAFVFLSGGSAAPRPSGHAIPAANTSSSTVSSFTDYRVIAEVHRAAAALRARAIRRRRGAASSPRSRPPGSRSRRQRSSRPRSSRPPPSRQRRSRPPARPLARRRRHPAAAGTPLIQRSGSASATPKKAAATPGARVTAAGLTSSSSAPGRPMAARPASTAWPAPLTRIRYSTMPSPLAARRTGPITTGAEVRRSR